MTTRKQIVFVAAVLAAASLCFGQRPKLSPDLTGRAPEALVNVIVQYAQPLQQRHIDAVLRKGGRHIQTLHVVNGAVYSVPAKSLADLANDPDVKYISPDRTVNAASISGSQLSPDYKLQAVGADIAQNNGYNGNGIGVAIIDSVITNKQDFHGSNSRMSSTAMSTNFGNNSGYRVLYSQNMMFPGGSTDDVYGHGTHVAGIVAGDGSQSFGVYGGVAPQANLINLVVLNGAGAS